MNLSNDDAVKNKHRSKYLGFILGGIALFFYVLAWLKFWH